MLKRRAFRKIIITTFSLITIFLICIVPSKFFKDDNYLNLNIDVSYVTNLDSNDIYLLADNGYLTKTSIVLNEEDIEEKIKNIIDYLIIDKSSKIPSGLYGIIPKNTVVNSISIDNSIVTVDFTQDLLKTSKERERKVIEALTYSLINLDGVEGVRIKIDGKYLDELPQTKEKLPDVLNRNFGINKVFEITGFNDTTVVTTFYLNDINDKLYYVPVTKYINDDREKIKIIIDNLSSNYIYESSLMSLLPQNTELINYEIENNKISLNFSNDIFFNDNVIEEVVYQLTESVFSNYDVDDVALQVNGSDYVDISRCCGIKNIN